MPNAQPIFSCVDSIVSIVTGFKAMIVVLSMDDERLG
jgi:hypothetical protein